ncbi:migration and invasion-inhibitory protein [Dunckerocampus dactyliophorus]|uniref:migration and invasion-inhibitory protein n=1 Tax=Dunckerocampus dactyliophorus TaxID=161453 RepID=UPI002404ED94|nr:migration and invasion-inhibitory protein [Dunckerocampus dactyliophorus]
MGRQHASARLFSALRLRQTWLPVSLLMPRVFSLLVGGMCERQMTTRGPNSSPFLTARRGGVTAEKASPSEMFSHGDGIKSSLTSRSNGQKMQNRVTFQTDAHAEEPAHRRRLHPLLGYDWIAGVLDVQNALAEHSDDFYDELQAFRTHNKRECIHQPHSEFPLDEHSAMPLVADTGSPQADTDTHECTFSYKLNTRLFPVPVHSPICCPVCKRLKSSHPHTITEPAHVRVSIPHSRILPSYKYKAHRRCSFDPSDSLGLPSHCLLGWSNKVQSFLPLPSNLDLRSHLTKDNFTEKPAEEGQDQVTRGAHSDHTPPICRLARHNFQQFSPRRKLRRIPSSTER